MQTGANGRPGHVGGDRVRGGNVEYANIRSGWDGLRFVLTFACAVVCGALGDADLAKTQ